MTDAADAMLRTMRGLRAVREYTDAPVDDDALAAILGVARWTGSAQNRQPWRFVIVRDRGMLDRLGALMPNASQVGRAPLAVAIVMPGDRAVLDAFDEGRITERILLAAAARDLAAAVGWVPQEARAQAASLLGVPEGRLLRSVVAIGHAAPGTDAPRTRPGTARLPLDELVHHERWREPDERDG